MNVFVAFLQSVLQARRERDLETRHGRAREKGEEKAMNGAQAKAKGDRDKDYNQGTGVAPILFGGGGKGKTKHTAGGEAHLKQGEQRRTVRDTVERVD